MQFFIKIECFCTIRKPQIRMMMEHFDHFADEYRTLVPPMPEEFRVERRRDDSGMTQFDVMIHQDSIQDIDKISRLKIHLRFDSLGFVSPFIFKVQIAYCNQPLT